MFMWIHSSHVPFVPRHPICTPSASVRCQTGRHSESAEPTVHLGAPPTVCLCHWSNRMAPAGNHTGDHQSMPWHQNTHISHPLGLQPSQTTRHRQSTKEPFLYRANPSRLGKAAYLTNSQNQAQLSQTK